MQLNKKIMKDIYNEHGSNYEKEKKWGQSAIKNNGAINTPFLSP